jgi:hypothetical protein
MTGRNETVRIIFLLYMEINHKRAGCKNIKKRKEEEEER